MISIVIPLYNKASSIRDTLNSVLAQTYSDFEIIIVDDGSTDESCHVVESFNDSRILLVHQTNAGVAAARNRGIEEAKGEYIAFLDADDKWKPDYLAKQASLAEKYPFCDVFATNYEFCDGEGKITKPIIRRLPFKDEDGELTNYFEVASHSHPPICSISIMVRKSAITEIGGFPVGIRSGEDLLTWARLATKYRIAYNSKVCAIYNVPSMSPTAPPTRIPQEPDMVGKELADLYSQNKQIKGLKTYVGLWHKMRASVYLRVGRRNKARQEIFKALHFHLSNPKLHTYLVLSLLPKQCITAY